MDDQQARVAVECLRDRFGSDVIAVYLYGSAAEGRQRPDSDIDLAILPRRPLDVLQRFEAAQQLATLFHREVDLVDLRRAPAFLRGQVVGTGRRLYVADELETGEFEARALAEYARLHEESRQVIQRFDSRYLS